MIILLFVVFILFFNIVFAVWVLKAYLKDKKSNNRIVIIDEENRNNKDVDAEMKKCSQCGGNQFKKTATGMNKCLYCGTMFHDK